MSLSHLPSLTISIVSHCQAQLVQSLLDDLRQCCFSVSIEVVLTINVQEVLSFDISDYRFPIRIILNSTPKGFGENHNAAFKYCSSNFFCVVNPDVCLRQNPFPALLACLRSVEAGVIGPKVVNMQGGLEDGARPFPTPLIIFKKLFGNRTAALYPYGRIPEAPDWIAGMFMLFDAKAFQEVGGFDERYFLYYEDADICARMHLAGWSIGYCKDAEVIHDARRDSHRKLRYLKWHLASMLRFFMSSAYRTVKNKQ